MKPCQIEKKQRIEASAIALFLEKGIDETSVNDIVKDAKLAKGTFYVYYKDKSELIHEIVSKKNLALMEALIVSAKQDHEEQGIPWANAFLKRLIQFFQENPQVLKLIHHAILREGDTPVPIPLLRKQIACFDAFIQSFQKNKEPLEDTRIRFLLAMETCAIVCHNAIFFHHPDTMEHIASMFYTSMCESFLSAQGGQL